MITPEIVAEVRRLLNETPLSQRKIAALVGVSRGTVSSIAADTRPDYVALQERPDEWCQDEDGPPQRCGGCGALVYMPCQFCRAMKSMTNNPKRSSRSNSEMVEEISLDLRPEHQARYEEIRRLREENGGEPAFAGERP